MKRRNLFKSVAGLVAGFFVAKKIEAAPDKGEIDRKLRDVESLHDNMRRAMGKPPIPRAAEYGYLRTEDQTLRPNDFLMPSYTKEFNDWRKVNAPQMSSLLNQVMVVPLSAEAGVDALRSTVGDDRPGASIYKVKYIQGDPRVLEMALRMCPWRKAFSTPLIKT